MKKHTRLLLVIPFLLVTIVSGLVFLHLRPTHADAPQNLVANPDFANGLTSWQEGSLSNVNAAHVDGIPDSARFCIGQPKIDTGSDVVSFCDDQLWQNITLPASFTTATLSYQLQISSATQEVSDFQVQLRTSTGTTIATLQEISSENSSEEGFTTYTFDVTPQLNAYKGQTVQLYFHEQDGGASFFHQIAEFELSNVSLTA